MGYFQEIYQAEILHRCVTVYMYLKDRTGRKGTCWPAIGTIARDLGLSRSAVKRALKDLEEKGYLKREIRHRENGGGYFKPLYHFVKKKGTPGEKCALTVDRG